MYEPVPPADPRDPVGAAGLEPRAADRRSPVRPAPVHPGGGAVQGVSG